MFWWLSSTTKFQPSKQLEDTERSRTRSILRHMFSSGLVEFDLETLVISCLAKMSEHDYESNRYTGFQAVRSWEFYLVCFFFYPLYLVRFSIFCTNGDDGIGLENCWWFSLKVLVERFIYLVHPAIDPDLTWIWDNLELEYVDRL